MATTNDAGRRSRPVLLLGYAALLLLVADAVGLVHVDGHHHHGRPSVTSTPGGTAPRPATTTTPPTTGVPVTDPPPADLSSHLLVPDDMGGYYVVDGPDAATDLGGSACLSALDGPDGPDAHASTYFAVGNLGNLPAILELVDDYSSDAGATRAFAADKADLARCTSLTTTLAGGEVASTHLTPLVLAPIGDGAVAERGTFSAGGLPQSIQIAVVEGPREVLLMIQIDHDPPYPDSSIYDNFPSAVVTAYGKLA